MSTQVEVEEPVLDDLFSEPELFRIVDVSKLNLVFDQMEVGRRRYSKAPAAGRKTARKSAFET